VQSESSSRTKEEHHLAGGLGRELRDASELRTIRKMEHADPAQLFVHVRIAMGIVLGLSITRLLAGLARIVQHPGREKIYPLHLAWVFAVLLFVIDFWWWEFRLSTLPRFSFTLFVFVVFYASLFYFLCALLFPDDIRDYAGYEDYFMSRRKWFFGILALTAIADVADTLLKGVDYFNSFGFEYPAQTIVTVALCLVAVATRNQLFHAVFVGASILYQVSWIVRRFDVIA
jgi:hypothetical protein